MIKESSKRKYEALERKKRGVRKCSRCKNEFPYKKTERICKICKTLCSGCGTQLTQENIDKSCIRRKKYYCKSCIARAVRESRDPINQKDYDLQRTYGISLHEYQELLKLQQGVCWICGKSPGKKALSVDHEHQKGEKEIRKKGGVVLIREKVRGLLCWSCNTAIAKFKDSPSFLRKAAEYLEQKPARAFLKRSKN